MGEDPLDAHSLDINVPLATVRKLTAHTASYTLNTSESGTIHTNLGAGGAISFTLPNNAPKGVYYTVSIQVAQVVNIVIHAAGGIFYIGGTISTDDGGADLKATADDEGETITLVSDGADGWVPTALVGTWTVSQP